MESQARRNKVKRSNTCKVLNFPQYIDQLVHSQNPFKRLQSGVDKTPIVRKRTPQPDFNIRRRSCLNRGPQLQTNRLSISLAPPRLTFHWRNMGQLSETREDSVFLAKDSSIFQLGGSVKQTFSEHSLSASVTEELKSPSSRRGHSMIPYRDFLIMYGGFVEKANRMSGKVHIYSIPEKSWQSLKGFGPIPSPRSYHACTQLGRHMIIYGGDIGGGQKSDELILFDLQSFSWVFHDMAAPEMVSHATLTPVVDQYVKKKLNFSMLHLAETKCFYAMQNSGVYLFGGIDSSKKPNNCLYRLVGSNGVLSWEYIRTNGGTPKPRYAHAAASIGHYLFIYGGKDDSKDSDKDYHAFSDLHVLNIINWKWEEILVLGTNPNGRWGHCLLEYKSGLLVLGGTNNNKLVMPFMHFLETDNKLIQELNARDLEIQKDNLKITKDITDDYRKKIKEIVETNY